MHAMFTYMLFSHIQFIRYFHIYDSHVLFLHIRPYILVAVQLRVDIHTCLKLLRLTSVRGFNTSDYMHTWMFSFQIMFNTTEHIHQLMPSFQIITVSCSEAIYTHMHILFSSNRTSQELFENCLHTHTYTYDSDP
jgi:hypothetical protein